jgi:uncharacterized HAD superfamily protein
MHSEIALRPNGGTEPPEGVAPAVAIDIDGVLANTRQLFVDHLQSAHGLSIGPRDLTAYRLIDNHAIPDAAARRTLEWFVSGGARLATPVPGSVAGVRAISPLVDIFYWTSRHPRMRNLTEEWIRKSGLTRAPLLMPGHDKRAVGRSFSAIIDDDEALVVDLASESCRGLLFVPPFLGKLDRLPNPHVRRVRTWPQIVQLLSSMTRVPAGEAIR